jgi:hypothetical protein
VRSTRTALRTQPCSRSLSKARHRTGCGAECLTVEHRPVGRLPSGAGRD